MAKLQHFQVVAYVQVNPNAAKMVKEEILAENIDGVKAKLEAKYGLGKVSISSVQETGAQG